MLARHEPPYHSQTIQGKKETEADAAAHTSRQNKKTSEQMFMKFLIVLILESVTTLALKNSSTARKSSQL